MQPIRERRGLFRLPPLQARALQNGPNRLINAGIPGVLLVWFMFRLERILGRFDKTVQLVARAIIRLLERTNPDEAAALSEALYRVNGEEG